jgi:hypothetical protein
MLNSCSFIAYLVLIDILLLLFGAYPYLFHFQRREIHW